MVASDVNVLVPGVIQGVPGIVVGLRVSRVLTKEVPTGENSARALATKDKGLPWHLKYVPYSHIVDASLRNGAVIDICRQVTAEI